MIDFRYHVVSLVSVFLALAVGVALGAGLLGGALSTGLTSQETDSGDLRRQLAADGELQSFQSGFAEGVAPQVIGKQLAGRTVALFVLPGADGAITKAVTRDVGIAGGKVTGQVQLTGKLVDPGGRQFAQGVAEQSLDGVDGVAQVGDTSYGRVGAALARAYLADAPGGAAVDEPATTIASALGESGLVQGGTAPTQRAGLAVVVAGAPSASGTGDVVAAIAAGMDAGSQGVVVAGDAASARGDGAVAGVRSGDAASTVSTVDAAETSAGSAVTVLALREQAADEAGQYGSVDAADGALPTAS